MWETGVGGVGGAATQATYTCANPLGSSGPGWMGVGWERPWRDLERWTGSPLHSFWGTGATDTAIFNLEVRKPSGKSKDFVLVFAGAPSATRAFSKPESAPDLEKDECHSTSYSHNLLPSSRTALTAAASVPTRGEPGTRGYNLPGHTAEEWGARPESSSCASTGHILPGFWGPDVAGVGVGGTALRPGGMSLMTQGC